MAAFELSLPRGIAAVPLREDDLHAALSLSREAGWNQVAADWRIFLELGSAIGLRRAGGPLIATAAMLPYERRFAWISMVLVTKAERRQGLARCLLRRCVDELLARDMVPVLDATPAGRAVYSSLGFQDCWTLRRLVAHMIRMPNGGAGHVAAIVRAFEERDWQSIIAYDKKVFGADRSALLRRLAGRLPHAAFVAERRGQIIGYLFGRDGRTMSQLGPLSAEDGRIAIALIKQAITAVPPPIAIDVPDRHVALGEWLCTLDFRTERSLTRMVYRRSSAFDDGARLFAIAGPELG